MENWTDGFKTALPKTVQGGAFGAGGADHFIDDGKARAFASCYGVNLAGVFRGVGFAGVSSLGLKILGFGEPYSTA